MLAEKHGNVSGLPVRVPMHEGSQMAARSTLLVTLSIRARFDSTAHPSENCQGLPLLMLLIPSRLGVSAQDPAAQKAAAHNITDLMLGLLSGIAIAKGGYIA